MGVLPRVATERANIGSGGAATAQDVRGKFVLNQLSQALENRFRVLRQLRDSGPARVYLATQWDSDNNITTDELIELRVLDASIGCAEEQVELFYLEGRAA